MGVVVHTDGHNTGAGYAYQEEGLSQLCLQSQHLRGHLETNLGYMVKLHLKKERKKKRRGKLYRVSAALTFSQVDKVREGNDHERLQASNATLLSLSHLCLAGW